MTKRMLIMLGAVVLLVALLALGFFLHIRQLMASAPKPGPQTVSSTIVRKVDWQPHLSSVGTMVAVRGVDVTTEIAGLVRTINFKSGQDVAAGQLLVQLNADADIAQLRALEAASELAASVLARDRQQFAVQAISQAQIDSDLADLKSKQALAAQQAALVQKKTIRAPFAGKLGITTVNPGQYLNPGDKIVTLQTIDPIYVDFYIPQKNLSGLQVGQVLNLSSDAYANVVFAGKVSAISSKVDPTTRNVQVEATVANPKRQLLPGMFANVNVEVGDKKLYLTLPQTAITYNPYGSTVFVVQAASQAPKPATASSAPAAPPPKAGDLVVQQVFVTTGETRGDQVAVLTGLTEGQQVVTSGQIKLKNGSPVVISNVVQPLNNPRPTPQEQ
ncbi:MULTISPECIES: efflux RND transporter periplasmic adaptor subunit [unclassified Janthinobacterium]|uniref:efflux RND transporter periplasmic adaptor subunit n=1 Tax=unclassified Janthinobacterium TaxID=2610881 RepID=UPI0016212C65|nr:MULTISPECIES: efflux RND transporter periplasmic adaptor subunit [unclassified Janthinobacterium]MBB5369400.1 membrane fusion protein (multidrug efflux system) [Janthinobacterium sp. K2C7]MBB5381064.1 membrane fusion protein (multidrug efflux system) [Janthinobacterium sp. K2Li3]MBB5387783.1 membrane fusion protein (multidrug efflux system) [Janthinobacterium sp. K2E3]